MRSIGQAALYTYVAASKWIWDRLPAALTRSAPLHAYAGLVHAVVRRRSRRQQYFGTFFFRNRPQLRLLAQLAGDHPVGARLTLAFLGCSSGAELYSVLWTIRSARPDLKVVAHAVDISREILAVAERGVYSLTDSGMVAEPIFARMTADEMREMFDLDRERNQVAIKPWLKEGVAWHAGDAAAPDLAGRLEPCDIVIANNFLCHMRPAAAEAGLRNVARLVRPGGYLVSSGVDLDIRARVALERGWQPVRALLEDIHDGDPSVRGDWPWKYWGLEPLRKREPHWDIRYASVFRVGRPLPAVTVDPDRRSRARAAR